MGLWGNMGVQGSRMGMWVGVLVQGAGAGGGC